MNVLFVEKEMKEMRTRRVLQARLQWAVEPRDCSGDSFVAVGTACERDGKRNGRNATRGWERNWRASSGSRSKRTSGSNWRGRYCNPWTSAWVFLLLGVGYWHTVTTRVESRCVPYAPLMSVGTSCRQALMLAATSCLLLWQFQDTWLLAVIPYGLLHSLFHHSSHCLVYSS